MSYDDTNKGALFKNHKKESDRHPDYKGSLNVNGQEFWISSWLNTSKKGEKYMSLSVTPKDNESFDAPKQYKEYPIQQYNQAPLNQEPQDEIIF